MPKKTKELSLRYPSPYEIVDGCLHKKVTEKNHTYSRKLCNFTPKIINEITLDDGAVDTKRLKLGGEHSSGRTLPEIEIAGAELASFNWLIERWGADCVLEPGTTVKDSVRHAIQLTAVDADKKTLFAVTGWKKIDDGWKYLLPNDSECDVKLPGKLSRYEKASEWSEQDLSTVWFMTDEFLFAPKEIVLTLLSFTFLSPLNEFLHQANCEPKFVLFLLGHTGTRKSTLAALFLSFFGRFSASDLPLSFRDTANSIMHHAFSLKDVLTCIDDYHPGSRQEEAKLNSTAQAVMRGYGDRIGKGRLKSDSSPMESRPPQGNAIVTAEFAPSIGESGTARYFPLELKSGDVNLDNLSIFQREAENGTLRRCTLAYTEWIRQTFLKDDETEKQFVKTLKESFEFYRDEFMKSKIRCHGRVPENVAWLLIGMSFFLLFMESHEMISSDESQCKMDEFKDCLYRLAKKQSNSIERNRPTHMFIQKLYSLLESGQAVVIDKNNYEGYTPIGFVGYEDSDYYYLISDAAHKAVRKFCEEQGETFSVTKNALIKALAEENLIETGDKNTKVIKVGTKSIRVIALKKSTADVIADMYG